MNLEDNVDYPSLPREPQIIRPVILRLPNSSISHPRLFSHISAEGLSCPLDSADCITVKTAVSTHGGYKLQVLIILRLDGTPHPLQYVQEVQSRQTSRLSGWCIPKPASKPLGLLLCHLSSSSLGSELRKDSWN